MTYPDAQCAVGQNLRSQTTPAFQKFLRARRNGLVHPVAWTAFLRALESDTLHLKFLADERFEIDAPGDDIATDRGRQNVRKTERVAEIMKHFDRKEGDLSLVLIAIIKKAISLYPVTSHTIDPRNLYRRMFVGRSTMMAKEIVRGGNVEMRQFHCYQDNIAPAEVTPRIYNQ